MADAEEQRRKVQKPNVSIEEVRSFVEERFGLSVKEVEELNSYDDKNFLIVTKGGGEKYTCKVHNGVDSENVEFLYAQSRMMRHLLSMGTPCPQPVCTVAGEELTWLEQEIPQKGRKVHAVRLLTYIEGTVLGNTNERHLLEEVGKLVGTIDCALQSFVDNALERDFLWDLKNTDKLTSFLGAVQEEWKHAIAASAIENFERKVKPHRNGLRCSPIHNDINDQNIIVDVKYEKVLGVVDFGDIVNTWLVNDIAICLCYFMMEKRDPLKALCAVFRGYCKVMPLLGVELYLLPSLIRCRLACTGIMSAYSYQKDPTNKYLLLTAEPGWKALHYMSQIQDAEITALLTEVQISVQENRAGE